MYDIINLIYDTLFQNTLYDQFDPEQVENQFLDYASNCIEFDKDGKHYILQLKTE